jgi:hypothetical protein
MPEGAVAHPSCNELSVLDKNFTYLIPDVKAREEDSCTLPDNTRTCQALLGDCFNGGCCFAFPSEFIELSEVERYHADKGDPEQRHMLCRPQGRTLRSIENLRKLQRRCKVCNLVRKKSNCSLSVKSTEGCFRACV